MVFVDEEAVSCTQNMCLRHKTTNQVVSPYFFSQRAPVLWLGYKKNIGQQIQEWYTKSHYFFFRSCCIVILIRRQLSCLVQNAFLGTHFGPFLFVWYIFPFLVHFTLIGTFSYFFKHVFFLLNFSLFGTSSFWNISVFLLHLCFLGASCFLWGPEASSPSKHLNGWNPVKNGFVSGRKCPSVCLVRFILTFSILLPWGSPPCVSLFVCDALS